MDAKLNPISSSAAGTPLTGKSVSAQSGKQSTTRSSVDSETIRDTLETSDREADGRQPLTRTEVPEEPDPPTGQGGLLDLEG